MVSVVHTIWGPVLGLYICWRRLASFGPFIGEDLTISRTQPKFRVTLTLFA